jgi:muramoyltetrapeptide carboxypeptidase
MGGEYFRFDAGQRYILFIEDNEEYSEVIAVSAYLSHIEQSPFIRKVSGLVFGHYSDNVPENLLSRLARFGVKHNIPVVYTDDFGHFTRHSIIPIGALASLDAGAQKLQFIW